MSFEITPVHGTVEELGSDLAVPPLHEREEFVIDEVKKAIYHVVTSLGGYLSVSCSGNINPVGGETGDVVQIYITSLPQPDSAPVETPIATAPGIETGEPTPVTEESPQPQPVIPSENVEPVQQETAPSESVEASVNPVGATPVISPAASAPVEANTTSIGQAEAQEIAQATPPAVPDGSAN